MRPFFLFDWTELGIASSRFNGVRWHVVWFKRDFRITDHAPLAAALERAEAERAQGHEARLLALYIHEPGLWEQPTYAPRHARFVWESWQSLQIKHPQLPWISVVGEAVAVLDQLQQTVEIACVYSHEEIGIQWTYSRDMAVKKAFAGWGILWEEFPYGSVRRGRKTRSRWVQEWHAIMHAPVTPSEQWLKDWTQPTSPNQSWDLGFPHFMEPNVDPGVTQKGGVGKAQAYLRSFLDDRYRGYAAGISKPAKARLSCSRLSPYLAWGNLSLREVYQAFSAAKKVHPHRGLTAFGSRLRWREHFIQKFESEHRMEWESVNRGGLDAFFRSDPMRLRRWEDGQTGVPLVDACMRSLCHTGYLNFRMRAMIVSYATHVLQLPWKDVSVHLARQFLDYEPGIHYPQLQMQAGVTGINTVRIYNPVKQALEQDADGDFIALWVPEVAHLPMPWRAAPWTRTALEEGMDELVYPRPMVELKPAMRAARQALYRAKKTPEARAEAQRILATHVQAPRAGDKALPLRRRTGRHDAQ